MTVNDLELGHVSGQRVTLDLSPLATAAERRVLRLLLVRALAKGAATVSGEELAAVGGLRNPQDLALGLAELVLKYVEHEESLGSYGYLPLFSWVSPGADGQGLEVTLNKLNDALKVLLSNTLQGGKL